MPKLKKIIRFSTQEQILILLDRTKVAEANRAVEAADLERQADQLIRSSALAVSDIDRVTIVGRAQSLRDLAAKKRVRQNYYGAKARRLAEALSEFRTLPMPFLEDNTVGFE